MILITNNSAATISGRYNGAEYKFAPKMEMAVPHEVAAHIFGYGQDAKGEAFLRLGWLGRESENIERLNQVSFAEADTTYQPKVAAK